MRDLTRGPIPRLLLTMAAPIAVGLFVHAGTRRDDVDGPHAAG